MCGMATVILHHALLQVPFNLEIFLMTNLTLPAVVTEGSLRSNCCLIGANTVYVSEQKPAMFAHKLKFILLPQLIATLNNYACTLPPLANVNCSAFPSAFADHVNSQLVKWCQWRALIWQQGPYTGPIISTHLSLNLVEEYRSIVGTCRHFSHSKLNSAIYVILPLCFSLCYHPPTAAPFLPNILICWPSTDAFLDKTVKTCKNQPLSICQVSCKNDEYCSVK